MTGMGKADYCIHIAPNEKAKPTELVGFGSTKFKPLKKSIQNVLVR
jgi:hypothetical protein